MTQLKELAQITGPANVLTGDDAQSYQVDWRARYTGAALAVVRPGSVVEVAAVAKWCAANNVPIVPQGGNTGLCGGATPDGRGNVILLSLARLNRIRALDTDNDTIEVDAG